MAKFKKNFWTDREYIDKETGKKVVITEPEWYSKQYDPTDRLGGFKGEDKNRPEGSRIPHAIVNGESMPIKDAFQIYKAESLDSFRLRFEQFKTALLNGTTFKTMKGDIKKP